MEVLSFSITSILFILVAILCRLLFMNQLPKSTFKILWYLVILRVLIPYEIKSIFSIEQFLYKISSNTVKYYSPGINVSVNAVDAYSPMNRAIFTMWVTIMIAICFYFLILHVYWRKRYGEAVPVKNDFIEKWQETHRLKRKIRIKQLDRIDAPLTYGLFNPVILLPKSLCFSNKEQLSYVLAHEYTHIKQFDILMKYLLAICVCIHWYNPFIWLMYRMANKDIEISCDESTLLSFPSDIKSKYALTLLQLEKTRAIISPVSIGFCKRGIEERILMIMKFKKKSGISIGLSLILVCFLFLIFGTSFSKNTEDESERLPKYSLIEKTYMELEREKEMNAEPDIPGIVVRYNAEDDSYTAHVYDRNENQIYREEDIAVDMDYLEEVIDDIYGKILY